MNSRPEQGRAERVVRVLMSELEQRPLAAAPDPFLHRGVRRRVLVDGGVGEVRVAARPRTRVGSKGGEGWWNGRERAQAPRSLERSREAGELGHGGGAAGWQGGMEAW